MFHWYLMPLRMNDGIVFFVNINHQHAYFSDYLGNNTCFFKTMRNVENMRKI